MVEVSRILAGPIELGDGRDVQVASAARLVAIRVDAQVRLPTYEASTTMLPGSWCCRPNE